MPKIAICEMTNTRSASQIPPPPRSTPIAERALDETATIQLASATCGRASSSGSNRRRERGARATWLGKMFGDASSFGRGPDRTVSQLSGFGMLFMVHSTR